VSLSNTRAKKSRASGSRYSSRSIFLELSKAGFFKSIVSETGKKSSFSAVTIYFFPVSNFQE
jgi:hypothetical protein